MIGRNGGVALAFTFLISCAAGSPPRQPALLVDDGDRHSFNVSIAGFSRDMDLDEVEFDPDVGTTADIELEREREGIRAQFGVGDLGGYVELFVEDIESFDADMFGITGGAIGAPRVNDPGSSVAIVIPFRTGLSIALGDSDDFDGDLAYIELDAEGGIGAEWNGIRASAGVIAGEFVGFADTEFFEDVELEGFNFGQFFEVYYKHPDFPLFARVRFGAGDYDVSELSIGGAW